jgi:putative transcriptional regulator
MPNHPNRGPQGPFLPPAPEVVRALRDDACLSQTHAASLVHAGLRTWQQWEAGDRKMPAATMELWCLALVVGSYIAPGEWLRPFVRPDFIVFFQRPLPRTAL